MNNISVSQSSKLVGITMILWGLVFLFLDFIRLKDLREKTIGTAWGQPEDADLGQTTYFIITYNSFSTAAIVTGVILIVFSRLIQKILK